MDQSALLAAVDLAAKDIQNGDFDGDFIGNRRVFVFCQYLRSVVNPGEADSETLEHYLKTWYNQCKDFIVDEDGPLSFSEVRCQFISIWDGNKVKLPKGELLAMAEARAKALTETHPEFLRYDSPRIRLLGNVLAEISELRGDGMVFMSQKDAARIMGRSERVGHETLMMFCTDGILERTRIGHTGLASEYKYIKSVQELPF